MPAPDYRRLSLYGTLRRLHLLDNLKLCLDAGDRRSFEGGGDTWRDVSGGGYDFYRGSGTGADAADPTHNGVAGRRTKDEYFSYDGGDYFTLAQANPAWLQTFHKAGSKFTIAEWTNSGNLTGGGKFFGGIGDGIQPDTATKIGFVFGGGSDPPAGGATLVIGNGGGTFAYEKSSVAVLPANALGFLAVSVDMAAGNVIFQLNGTTESYAAQSLSSPSAASATATLQIGAAGSGVVSDTAGTGHNSVAVWDDAKTGAQLLSIYNATKARFGL